jgi:hypothetical protein
LAAHKSRLGELKGLVAQIAKDVGLEAGGLLEAEVDALGKRLEDVRESLATLAEVAETKAANKDLCTDDLLQTKSFLASVQQVGLCTSNGRCYCVSHIVIKVIRSRRMRWAGHVASMGAIRNAYEILVGKPEGKRPLGRLKRRCEDNIRMDGRENGWEVVDWIHVAQDRDQWQALVNVVMNPHFP